MIYRGLGNASLCERDFTNAIKCYTNAIRWEPHHFVPYEGITEAYQGLNDYAKSFPYMVTNEVLRGGDESNIREWYAVLRRAFDRDGVRGYWQQQWEVLKPDPSGGYWWRAAIQAHLGHKEEALHFLEQSYATGEDRDLVLAPITTILYESCFDCLHHEDRFLQLLKKMGLREVMRSDWH
jgi:hypothetical protein